MKQRGGWLIQRVQQLNGQAFYLVFGKPKNCFPPSFDKPVNSIQWHFLLPFIPFRKNFCFCVCPNQRACHFTLWQNDTEKAEWPIIRCKFYACHFERLWIPSFIKFSIENTLGQNTLSLHQNVGNSPKELLYNLKELVTSTAYDEYTYPFCSLLKGNRLSLIFSWTKVSRLKYWQNRFLPSLRDDSVIFLHYISR